LPHVYYHYQPIRLKGTAQITKASSQKIEKAINALAENPRPVGVKKLKGNNEDLYRIRSEIIVLFMP